MDNLSLHLVPVILRRHYRSRSKHKNYTSTVAILATPDGRVVSAGVSFEGGEYEGKKVTHSRVIGREVAIGRAVKALLTKQHNGINEHDCHQARKVDADFGIGFTYAKGINLEGAALLLKQEIADLVFRACEKDQRLVVHTESGKWKFD
jgi:hypothetical protein